MDLKKETAKLLSASSRQLAQIVASTSFEFWERKDFRLYVEFESLTQTEKDRMFNEFEVSVLGLFLLHFDNVLESTPHEEQKIVFKILRDHLAADFMQIMADLGIEKEHLAIWQKLIDMRIKEYREDFKLALSESKNWNELKGDEPMRRNWARIETITIDCLSHIRRGKVEKGDPLWKLIRKWLISLDVHLLPLTK